MDPQTIVASLSEIELIQLIAVAQARVARLIAEREAELKMKVVALLTNEGYEIKCRAFNTYDYQKDRSDNDKEESKPLNQTEYGTRYVFSFSTGEIVIDISIDHYEYTSMDGQELHTDTTIDISDTGNGDDIITKKYSNLWLEEYQGQDWEPDYERNEPGGSWDNDDPLDLSDLGEYKDIARHCTDLIKEHAKEIGFGRA